MQQISSGKRVWLIAIGAVMGVAAIANLVVAPGLSVILIGSYAAIAGAAFAESNGTQLRRTLSPLAVPITGSPAAREAVTRARRLSGTVSPEAVTDIGLIANIRQPDGKFRPAGIAQTPALDDDAIQPYIKISVPPDRSHRSVLVRFEILDRSGKTQFSRETEQYVRDGENLIACDRQLLLAGNKQIDRAGAWELQVSINGTLAAAYTFTVTAARGGAANDGELGNFSRQPPISANYSGNPGNRYGNTAGSFSGGNTGNTASSTSPVNTASSSDDDDHPQSLDDLLRDQRGGRS